MPEPTGPSGKTRSKAKAPNAEADSITTRVRIPSAPRCHSGAEGRLSRASSQATGAPTQVTGCPIAR